ncbi:MAG: SpoIIE family protein phosphatase [Thermoguttaceae bacterium]|nr:SpoIIE family protein phosphatase [Thermoguttaceae bacterium]
MSTSFVRALLPRLLPDARFETTRPLRKTFFLWTSALTAAAIFASTLVSFFFETRSAKREAAQTIRAKLLEAETQAERARENLATIELYERRASVCRARSAAEILRLDATPPDARRLEELARFLNLDEIDVVDENGICVASWPPETRGFDYSQMPETADFLRVLDDPTLEISQPLRPSATDAEQMFQYSAVARRDAPGLVEVGLLSARAEQARALANLARFIGSFRLGKNGRLFVFQNGVLLRDETASVDGAKTPDADFLAADVDAFPLDAIFDAKVDGASCFALARKSGDCVFVGALPKNEIFAQRRSTLVLIFVANALLFFGLFAVVSLLTRRLVVDGVLAINRSLAKIVDGDLGERVDVATTREFLELSNGLNATVDALQGAIDEVKRRVEKELELARRIQTAALPSVFPPFPERREFDIYAENRPMTSVGGDMFDYFFVDENRLFFYVADVSGHGVPAALFMMKTTALVKNLALSGLPLPQVVAQTNRYLAENNDATFVTAFFCLVDVATGRLEYVDAGHNPPFLREPNGRFREIAPQICLLLGVVDDAEFESATLDLAPGAALVLFTDGVTEAASASSEQFGVERALAAAEKAAATPDASAAKIVDALFAAVENFADGAERSDDVTALAFRYDGPKVKQA